MLFWTQKGSEGVLPEISERSKSNPVTMAFRFRNSGLLYSPKWTEVWSGEAELARRAPCFSEFLEALQTRHDPQRGLFLESIMLSISEFAIS